MQQALEACGFMGAWLRLKRDGEASNPVQERKVLVDKRQLIIRGNGDAVSIQIYRVTYVKGNK
jgi:hypothetical protein